MSFEKEIQDASGGWPRAIHGGTVSLDIMVLEKFPDVKGLVLQKQVHSLKMEIWGHPDTGLTIWKVEDCVYCYQSKTVMSGIFELHKVHSQVKHMKFEDIVSKR
ncbi:hypothetical protein [Phaeocystidibacter luteus]|uniref:Uncharacterized protein n=1 Tax=Phaeocystidibacter luteus TaxID=911197 RepID=A0A6N6RLV7_9FLAO|nr:hypothetical protein [Phaeocystidibacter luteus]KAB2814574.1 hypothetical protein F8C67_02205 [Phaeocystidibacter luteus]